MLMKKAANMKAVKKQLFLLFLLFGFSSIGMAQNNEITVRGKVESDTSVLLGVTVSLKSNSSKVTSTNDRGEYVIQVPADGILVFSFVGYETLEEPVNGRSRVDIILKPSSSLLSDVVVVGFGGRQKRTSAVSSITTVDVKELKGPTSNLTNVIAGRIPGMISFQQSGEPGLGTNNSTFYIRGLSTFGSGKQDPLILIDGVESSPTDMARLQPDDISDFSVLKDASAAAVYGARGANGVVLINTKSGKDGAPKYFFRAENRVSTNTRNIELADNITYMTLANEAVLTRNPLLSPLYSENKIAHTIAGDDPYLYPNNDWVGQLIKKYTANQSYNMNISGGTGRTTYYVAGTYTVDNGNLKFDKINDFNNNIKLANYSVRTNINLKLSQSTELIIRMYGQFDDYKGPIGGGALAFNNALWANPVQFPALFPRTKSPYIDHPLFGSARVPTETGLSTTLYVNPYAELVKGYSVYKTSNIQPQLELKQNLNFITPGLSINVMSYLRRYSYFDVSRSYNPFYYTATIDPSGKDYSIRVLNDGSATSVGVTGTEYLGYAPGNKVLDSRFWLQGVLNYNRVFGTKHQVGGMLIGYNSSYETGNAGSLIASLPARNTGLSGRFTYAFDNRYLAEFNFGYNGSERFAEKSRFGFFPSGGIGYRISNEKFFEPLKNFITDLKFRATYGISGNDQIGNVNERFLYLSDVNLNDGGYSASFGSNDGGLVYSRPGVSINRYANPGITWELSRQVNLGMDLQILRDIDITVDAYKTYRSQILQPKSFVENAYGLTSIPVSNYGKSETKGIDIAFKYQRSFGKNFWLNARGTFTYATSEVTKIDQNVFESSIPYLSRQGRSITQWWGYIAERLFIDDEEVANSPVQFGAGPEDVRAGDIKYRDINGDGVINSDDQVPLGYPTQPEIIYGFGSTFGYKRFDFSFYFQGSARSTFFINPWNVSPFYRNNSGPNGQAYENGLLKSIAESHWSEDNRDLYALWPRLSTYGVGNNNVNSTWWMRDGSFLRLKSVDLGYTFKDSKKYGLKAPRVYFSATNLFLISNFKLWDVEMGGNGLGYPIQAVYSLGATLNF